MLVKKLVRASGVVRKGEWVKIHLPSLEKWPKPKKTFKIARVFVLKKIFHLALSKNSGYAAG